MSEDNGETKEVRLGEKVRMGEGTLRRRIRFYAQ